jgi:chromosome partitioning protein
MNLAGGLTAAKYRVLVVDADPQASAMIWSLAQGQGSLSFEVRPARQFRRYSQLLDLDCDIVLVDTPPGIADSADGAAQFARQVIAGCDAILVPLRPSMLDFRAAETFVRYLAQAKLPTAKAALLLNGLEHTVTSRDAPAAAARLFAPVSNGTIFQTTIGRRAAITEVSGSGKTIFDYRPRHAATLEYANLTKEIIQWLRPARP